MSFSLCVFCLSFFLGVSARAQDWEKVELQSLALGENIWMLYGAGGNHVLAVNSDQALLVDSDYSEVSEKLLAIVKELVGQVPLQVVNTHWHFDHVGGNQALKKSGAVVLAHENVRKKMISGQYLAVIDHEQPPAAEEDLPDQTFTDKLEIQQGDERIQLFHVPKAHTNGDAMVYFSQANVLHTGDVMFFCGYPFIDINSGGTIDGVIDAVKVALSYCDDDTQVVGGHGPVTDKNGLEQYLGIMVDFRQAIAQAKADGQGLEEALASDVTAEVDEQWGKKMFPPAAFREMVYRSLPE
ncbi:MAG: MBL fold metallo-hydrolase [bacterium]|nr:MBL fold metallo-hydrolase [bacterium]